MNLAHKRENFFPGVYRGKPRAGNWVKAIVRTGNLFTEGSFASDAEVASYKRIQQAIANGSAMQEGSSDYYNKMYQVDPDSMTHEDYANWQLALQMEHRSDEGTLVLAAYPGAKDMQKFNTAEQNAKDSESWSPTGRKVDSKYYEGDPNTTVNVNGRQVPSKGEWVDIMDYGDADKHPEQWTDMDDFSGSKHYGDKDNLSKVDLSSKYNSEDGMPWYGPNAQFIVDDVNIGDNKYQGTSVRLSILDSDGNVSGKVELGHLTEINKDIYNAEKGVTKFDAGTILGKTNRLIGCSTGFHLHMTNLRGDRRALYRLMGGY